MKTFWFLCALLLISASTSANAITITALNIKWFGLNGSMDNDLGEETRAPTIKKHLEKSKLLSDVLIFEEIVDTDLLETKVLDNQYDCHSYDNSNPKHQHVVVCVKPEYTFEPADDNYVLQAVSLNGRVRPSVHGILTVEGKKIHLFGVHLKSSPTYSEWRLKQAQILADYIQKREEPALIIGDFNTYKDDAKNISSILKGDTMTEVQTPEENSWASTSKTKYSYAKLDRAWVSQSVVVESAHIVGPCNGSEGRGDLAKYNQEVSDHCAISLKINL